MAQILDQYGNVVTNGYSTNLTPEQTSAISLSSLTPQKPLNLPQVPADTTDYSQYITPTITSLASDYANVNKNYNSVQEGQKSNAQSQLDIMGLLTGKTSDLQAAEDAAGVGSASADLTNYASQLANLNAQASALNREATAIPIQVQGESVGRGRTESGVAPITTGRLRENALRALSIGQQADVAAAAATGSQLRLNAAKEKAKQLVDLKYKPLEDQLAIKKQQYELNKDILSSIDKKRTESLNAAIKREETALAEKKANEKEVSSLIIKASPYAPASILEKAASLQKSGASPTQVAAALGKYAGDYLGDLVKLSTISKNNAEYDKATAELKMISQPLASNAPAGSNAASQISWANSAINKESLSAGEREKINKSFAVVPQLANLSTALQKDQTSFFGGKVREIKASLGADASAGAIQAQITALVPQVARGTFGEVGVLTDADIANYRKVIGNLTTPNAQNAAVTAMTLTALKNGVKSQLDVAAASKLDVSRFVPLYNSLTTQINTINDDLGVTDQQVKSVVEKNPQLLPMVEQMVAEGRKGSEILQVLGVEI